MHVNNYKSFITGRGIPLIHFLALVALFTGEAFLAGLEAFLFPPRALTTGEALFSTTVVGSGTVACFLLLDLAGVAVLTGLLGSSGVSAALAPRRPFPDLGALAGSGVSSTTSSTAFLPRFPFVGLVSVAPRRPF